MPIEISETINHLAQERYRAIIIFTAPDKSSELSVFLRKVARTNNGKYLDLLDVFINSPELRTSVDIFSVEDMRRTLIQESSGQSLIVLDRADFLLDIWRRSDQLVFFRFLNDQWDGFKDGMKATLIVGLQSSEELKAAHMVDSQSNSRIFRLSAFNDI